MPLFQARDVAKKQNLDLVEVAATSVPPVCRLLDYGKFRYEQAKKERDAKKTQKVSAVREIRLRPKIGLHDFEAKAKVGKKLLEDGDKLKVTIMFRGRENTHPDIGRKLLLKMIESLKDVAAAEGQPLTDGRRMDVVLSPLPNLKAKKKTTVEEKEVVDAEIENP